MEWYVYLAHIFGGLLLANGIPHFTQGIAGKRFTSPFASPPGRGLSSSGVNVAWGSANFIGAWALLTLVQAPDPRPTADLIVIAIAFFLTAMALGIGFGSRIKSE